MLPVPSNDKSLNDWVDKLESNQVLSLLNLWNGKTNFDDTEELIEYLKSTFKKSGTIKQHYDDSLKKKKEKAIFDKLDFETE